MRSACLTVCVVLLLLVSGSAQAPLATANGHPTQSADAGREELTHIHDEARSHARQGRYAAAARLFGRGRREAARRGWRDGELVFLTNLGNSYNAMHQFGRAVDTYREAIKLAEESTNWGLVAAIESNVSGLYLAQGAHSEAGRALKRAREALVRMERPDATLSRVLLLEAKLEVARGSPARAVSLYRQAVQAADRAGDDETTTRALNLLGFGLLAVGRLQEAEHALLNAYRRNALLAPPVRDSSYLNLAELNLYKGNLDAAASLVEKAFQATLQTGSELQTWVLYLTRARVRSAQGDLDGAITDLEMALRDVNELRVALLPAHSVRTGARAGVDEVFCEFIEASNRLYFDSGRADLARRAFEVAEQHRAIALRESLAEASDLREHLAPEYWEILGELAVTEATLYGDSVPELRRRRDHLEARLTELEIQAGLLAGGRPRLEVATVKPVSVEAVRRALSPREALFSFHLDQYQSYLWAVTADAFELHRLPGLGELSQDVKAFRAAVVGSAEEEIHRRGTALHETLFGSVSPSIRQQPEWIFLADGPLFGLPFSALVTDGPSGREFLATRHSWRFLPAAQMLLDSVDEPWQGPLVAVGDPVYNTADPRWNPPGEKAPWGDWFAWPPAILGGKRMLAASLPRLAGSAQETRACARAFGGGRPPVFLTGPNANIAELRGALSGRPSVLHLATHVVSGADDERSGRIVLSLSDEGSPEFLGPSVIAGMDARAGLVVMSGCSSGSGSIVPGEGLMGLTRAWLRAGAHGVVATLWPAKDSSGEMLSALYRGLRRDGTGRMTPERALQAAQLEMLRSGTWRAQPEHWAAFFVVSRK